MNQIFVQASKEWSEFKRDRLSMALAFLLPLFSLILFGYGIRLESTSIPLYVQDQDNTYLSREYVARLYATNIIVPAAAGDTHSATDAIDRGLAKVSVVIPHGFAANIFRLKSSPLQVLVDGTDIANAQIVTNTIKAANLYFIGRLVESRLPGVSLAMVKPELRVWFNPGSGRATLYRARCLRSDPLDVSGPSCRCRRFTRKRTGHHYPRLCLQDKPPGIFAGQGPCLFFGRHDSGRHGNSDRLFALSYRPCRRSQSFSGGDTTLCAFLCIIWPDAWHLR